MTASLLLPRDLRHSSWYLTLLLPFLPLLTYRLGASSPGNGPSPGQAVLLGVLLGLAVILCVGGRAWWERSDGFTRKEIELLRPAWLTSLFLVQAASLGGPRLFGLALFFYIASCALLSSLTFGTEFQQGTVAGLLSQPIGRTTVWARKMVILAAALFSLLAVFVFTNEVIGIGPPAGVWLIVLLVATAVTWASTTYWTLATRGLLAGLVFSIAIPLLAIACLSAADRAIQRLAEHLAGGRWTPEEFLFGTALTLAGVYGTVCAILGRRRWMRLEATDVPTVEGGGIFLGGLRRSRSLTKVAHSPWRSLIVKELRLQTVTIVSCAFTLVLACGAPWVGEHTQGKELFAASIVMMSAVTVLLAAATSMAEERRLGTAEGQVLLPVRRTAQAWLKIGVALVLAVVAVVILAATLAPAQNGDPGSRELMVFVLAPTVFALATLASSAASSALRALLFGVLLTAIAVALGLLVLRVGQVLVRDATELAGASISEQPDRWLARAEALNPRQLEELRAMVGGQVALPLSAVLTFVSGVPVWIPCLVVLLFAVQNFRRPAEGGRGVVIQALANLLLFLVCGLGAGAVVRHEAVRRMEAVYLVQAADTLAWRRSLSPAERLLAGGSELQWNVAPLRGVTVPLMAVAGPDRKPVSMSRFFPMPLSTTNRVFLLRHGDLPPSIRDSLMQDAQRHRDPLDEIQPAPTPLEVPEPAAQPQFRMSPELMKRYGLLPQAAAESVSPSPQEVAPVPPANAATSPSPAPTMDPRLMRRYGLLPPTPPPAPPPPQPDTPR